MDWFNGMNEAINYIENNLDGEIIYSIAARYVCCSVSEFQRIFSFMTSIPLSEYIRKRRLTLAAYDIQKNKEKIIDVSVKYGYESPAAFSRAFNKLHGTTPASARNEGVKLKTYPRISFKIMIQGVNEMNYKIIQMNSFQVIGINKKMLTKDNVHWKDIPKLWDEFEETAIKDNLKSYAIDDNIFAITTYTEESDSFWYMISVAYNGLKNKHSYDMLTIPSGTYAMFEVPFDEEYDIGKFTMRIFKEWLPSTGYKLTGGAEIECCTKNRTVIYLPITE